MSPDAHPLDVTFLDCNPISYIIEATKPDGHKLTLRGVEADIVAANAARWVSMGWTINLTPMF